MMTRAGRQFLWHRDTLTTANQLFFDKDGNHYCRDS